jgi:hypothetical protein
VLQVATLLTFSFKKQTKILASMAIEQIWMQFRCVNIPPTKEAGDLIMCSSSPWEWKGGYTYLQT